MVNILLSTYNGDAYIEEQLDSIWQQEYADYRLYIRDDGSQDETISKIEGWIVENEAQEKVELIIGENIGFCQSFGQLLQKAESGDYWFFCDQDDIWMPDKISRAVQMLSEKQRGIPIAYHGSFQCVDDSMDVLKDYVLICDGYTFRKSLTSSICYGFAMAINRDMRNLLIQSDFSNIQSHDWYTTMIATAFGEIVFDDSIVAKHRIHLNNASPVNGFQKIKKGIKMLSEKSFYTENIREFYKQYSNMLSLEQDKLLQRFLNHKYSLSDSLYKAFYLGRWNTSLSVEIVLRALMLIGKV